jgi:hypothetical protein
MPDVIARGHYVDAGGIQLGHGVDGYAKPTGDVLAIGNHDIDGMLLA